MLYLTCLYGFGAVSKTVCWKRILIHACGILICNWHISHIPVWIFLVMQILCWARLFQHTDHNLFWYHWFSFSSDWWHMSIFTNKLGLDIAIAILQCRRTKQILTLNYHYQHQHKQPIQTTCNFSVCPVWKRCFVFLLCVLFEFFCLFGCSIDRFLFFCVVLVIYSRLVNALSKCL